MDVQHGDAPQEPAEQGSSERMALVNLLEALLFAAGEPVQSARLLDVVRMHGGDEGMTLEQLQQGLDALRVRHAGNGVELVQTAGGWWFRTAPQQAAAVRLLLPDRPQKLSRALLETLAIVLYRQPVTRAEIEEIRGVTVSSNITRALLDREWIRVIGHKEVPGRPALFASTRRLLDDLGVTHLDDLPPLEALRELSVDALDERELSDLALRSRVAKSDEAVDAPSQQHGDSGGMPRSSSGAGPVGDGQDPSMSESPDRDDDGPRLH